MAQVDPRDDTKTRWILEWYRVDPDRNERRYVQVAAFTRKRQFDRAYRRLQKELDERKAEGLSEDLERISGVQHRKGYLANVQEMRALDRQRRQAARGGTTSG